MAHPFGGHPTLQQYLEWLRSEGFEYRSGISGFDTVIRVEKEGKPLLHIWKVPMEEYLTPSMVDAYDRRLGVDSPFSKTPR